MNDLLILRARDINNIFDDKEKEIIDIVSKAYVAHTAGEDSLPHSIFLRFSADSLNRIIGLPAYLKSDVNSAGLKWISSFPDNIKHGMERASAILILNDINNGHPKAVLESSIISAKRTAASAALAATVLHSNREETTIGFCGCGRINKEIASFLKVCFPTITDFYAYDISKERCESFLNDIGDGTIQTTAVHSVEELMEKAPLVSYATTVGVPYISDFKGIKGNTTILNISLRDFSPEVVLACDNVVDDLDHVCRERTSIHLTEQKCNNRDFVRCPIADVVTGKQPSRVGNKPVMYSPFGLGVLDLALGTYALKKAEEHGLGIKIDDFLP